MKKKQLILCLLGSACLLAACQSQSRDAAQGGDALFGPAESTSVVSSLDEATQLRYQVLDKVHSFYAQLTGIELSSQQSSSAGDWHYETQSQQVYTEGSLTAYLTQETTKRADQAFSQTFYYDGQHHYVQPPHGKWQSNDNAATSMTYLYWTKLLIEGEGDVTVTDGPDGQWTVTKTVTETNLTEPLPGLLKLPLATLGQSHLQATLTYGVDQASGQLLTMAMDLTVKEGEGSTTYHVDAQSQVPETPPTADSLKPDLEVGASAVDTPDTDQWLAAFQAANPSRALTTYETVEGRQTGDQDENRLWVLNVQEGQVYAAVVGTIQDQAIQDYRLIWQGQAYAKGADGQISQEAVTPLDYYDIAVSTFVAQYDQVAEFKPDTEEGETAPQDASSWTYRQTFENDYDGFAAVAGALDVSNLRREEQALYGIDYVINKESLRLEAVYYWSLTAEDAAITHVNRLSFAHLNQQSAAWLQYVVDDALRQAVTP